MKGAKHRKKVAKKKRLETEAEANRISESADDKEASII